jgi:hypothetical protein
MDLRGALPLRRGFGGRLIEQGWRYDMGGDVLLDFRPGGLRCELTVAADTVLAERSAGPTPTQRPGSGQPRTANRDRDGLVPVA